MTAQELIDRLEALPDDVKALPVVFMQREQAPQVDVDCVDIGDDIYSSYAHSRNQVELSTDS